MITRRKSSLSDISALVVSQNALPRSHSGVKSISQVKPMSLEDFSESPDLESEESLEQTWSERLILHPEGYFRIIWDVVTMCLIFYQSISVPFMLCFDVATAGALVYIEFITTIFFLVDMFLAFNTAFYNKGKLEKSRRKIVVNYFRMWFWLDLICSFPYSWVLGGPLNGDAIDSKYKNAPDLLRIVRMVRFMRLFRLIRITKLKRIFLKFEDYIASNTLSGLFLFFRLLFAIFFIAHWIACWWYYVGDQDIDNNPQTWVSTINMAAQHSYLDKYVAALYWAFTTMTTVGYGDIVPFTLNEKIYATATMIVACGVFAYTVSSIGNLVSKQNADANAYRERVIAVNQYMKRKELSMDLQFRVRRYLEYIWEKQKHNYLDEQQILKQLNEPLRDEIYIHINGAVLKACPVFEKEFNAHFISQLTKLLKTVTFAPGDVVFQEGEVSTYMYFVQSGRISIYHQATNSTYVELSAGKSFGEIAFFTERSRCASALCLTYVDLFFLSREEMYTLTQKFPDALAKAENLKSKCAFGDLTELLVKCYLCDQIGHVANKCKKIVFNLDHDETRKKWIEGRKQTKRVNADQTIHPNFNRFLRRQAVRYDARNVVGVPRQPTNAFPSDANLAPAIHKFVGHTSKESSPAPDTMQFARTTDFPPNPFSGRPNYDIIYQDETDSDFEEEHMDPVRPHHFRRSLVHRRSGQEYRDRSYTDSMAMDDSVSSIHPLAKKMQKDVTPFELDPDHSSFVEDETKFESNV